MSFRRFSNLFRLSATVLVLAPLCPSLHAQALPAQAFLSSAPFPDAPTPFVEAAPVAIAPTNLNTEHKFWDRQNRLLFVATAALNGADFAATRANLQSGGQELNPVVRMFGRSTVGLAANFIGETAGVITLSYFFHKTGHHKLERAVALMNIASSAGAVTFDLTHR
jgi:hypothetical protein